MFNVLILHLSTSPLPDTSISNFFNILKIHDSRPFPTYPLIKLPHFPMFTCALWPPLSPSLKSQFVSSFLIMELIDFCIWQQSPFLRWMCELINYRFLQSNSLCLLIIPSNQVVWWIFPLRCIICCKGTVQFKSLSFCMSV